MKTFVYPYKTISAGAKALAQFIECRRIRVPETRSRYRNKRTHVIINWGNSVIPSWATTNTRWVNHPFFVSVASNKLKSFRILKLEGVEIPVFTTSKEEAADYIREDGAVIYCRKLLTGHSGAGIVVARRVSELVDAPLYTIRTPTTQEYRYHVIKDSIADVQKKARRAGSAERAPSDIRNHKTGWVYKREGVQLNGSMARLAIRAVEALQLDFGAVDIVWNPDTEDAYVLEVNTAPGLHGSSIINYGESLLNLVDGRYLYT